MKIIIILLVLRNLVWCFNLDLISAINIADIRFLYDESYFGYAVQFHSRSRLIVGAPKTKSNNDNKHPSGAVYDCLISRGGGDNCKRIKLHQKESTWNTSKSYNKYKKDAWIGGALSVDEKTGIMTVCGAQRENVTHLNGVCYVLPDTEKSHYGHITEKLLQLNRFENIDPNIQGERIQYIVTIPFFSLQEAGIFVQSFDDNIILGTPGVFNWKGHDRDQNRKQSTNTSVPDSYFNNDTLFQNYFGYSVAGGYFYKNQTKSYIIGTPSVGNCTGTVFVSDIPQNWNDRKLTAKLELEGQQLGEHFGEAVCVTDLDSDGYDDILVGAPWHSGNNNGETRNDEGKVYVFLNTGEGNFAKMNDLAGSKISGAKFGSAISYIGDLDHDGFPEIAVGAPHEQEDPSEENTGCIYIYKAGKDGVSANHVQRIRSQDINKRLKGFGISITNGFDIDNNKFNDIAVGAHESGQVFLIKSRPLMNVYHSVNRSDSSVFEIQQDTTKFDLHICVKYDVRYTNFPKNLKLNIEVTLEKNRAYFNSSEGTNCTLSYNATLEIEKFSCADKTVYLNIDYFENDSTYYSPLVIGLNYSVAEDLSTKFGVTSPMMNQSQIWYHVIKIPVKRKCDYATCCPGWAISAELPRIKEPFIIKSQYLTLLIVKVANYGVTSTLRYLQIDLPKDTSLLNIPRKHKCKLLQEYSWMCLINEVFQSEDQKILKFDLGIGITKIGSGFAHFNFSLFCDNENKTFKFSLKLKRQRFEISGKANPTHINTDIIEKNTFVTFTHDYRISNAKYCESVYFKCWIPENIPWRNSTLTLLESHNLTVISKNDSSCNKGHVSPPRKIMNEFPSPLTEDAFMYTYGYVYYQCSATVDVEGVHVQIKGQISVEALELILKTWTHFNYNTFLTIFHEDEGKLKKSVGTRFNSGSHQWPYYLLALFISVVILLAATLLYRKWCLKRRVNRKQE